MLANNSQNVRYYKRCVLNCPDGQHFYRLPPYPRIRRIWLSRLGSPEVNNTTRVCNKHFSDKMFAASNKRLTKFAIPDINIPSKATGKKLNGYVPPSEEDTFSEMESLMDQLLSPNEAVTKVFKQSPQPASGYLNEYMKSLEAKVKVNKKVADDCKSNAKDSRKASPRVNKRRVNNTKKQNESGGTNFLMNFKLRKEGRVICNVTEVPEYILVLTAIKIKDTVIMPPSNFALDSSGTEEKPCNDTSDARLKEKVTTKLRAGKVNENAKDTWPTLPESMVPLRSTPKPIKYVHYTLPEISVQRDRPVQVSSAALKGTRDVGIQCCLDEEPAASYEDEMHHLKSIDQTMEDHIYEAEGTKYECITCGEIVSSYESNLKHQKLHKEYSRLCYTCGRLFSNHVKLKNHERRYHLEPTLEIKKALRCPKLHCPLAFHSQKQLYKHIAQHAKKTLKRCKKCQQTFSSVFKLHSHISRRKCWR